MEPQVTTAAAEVMQNEGFVVHAFKAGGPAMWFIAGVGVVVLVLIIERMMKLRSLTVDKEDFNDKVFGMIINGNVRQAITFCDSRPTPLTSVLKEGLVQVLNKRPDEEVQVAMDGAVLRETPKLEGWNGLLAVAGNVATLIGLLGTIIGLILSFGSIADADPARKAEMLSRGISEALNCTAFGLIVAIPALVFYGFNQIRISRAINDMVETSMRVMNLVVANRDKIKD